MDIPASSPCYLLLFGVCRMCLVQEPFTLRNFVPIFFNKAKQSIKLRRRDIFIKSRIQKEYLMLGCYKRPSCTTHHTGQHNAECCMTRHIQTLPYKHKSTAAASAEENTPVFFSSVLFQSGWRWLWSFWSESQRISSETTIRLSCLLSSPSGGSILFKNRCVVGLRGVRRWCLFGLHLTFRDMKTMSEITGTKFPVMSANGMNAETERDDLVWDERPTDRTRNRCEMRSDGRLRS